MQVTVCREQRIVDFVFVYLLTFALISIQLAKNLLGAHHSQLPEAMCVFVPVCVNEPSPGSIMLVTAPQQEHQPAR